MKYSIKDLKLPETYPSLESIQDKNNSLLGKPPQKLQLGSYIISAGFTTKLWHVNPYRNDPIPIFYTIRTSKKKVTRGCWLCFYKNAKYGLEVCKLAVANGLFSRAVLEVPSNKNKQCAIYLYGDSSDKDLQFILNYQLVPIGEDGVLFDIVYDTPSREYHLSNYVNVYNGELLRR